MGCLRTQSQFFLQKDQNSRTFASSNKDKDVIKVGASG